MSRHLYIPTVILTDKGSQFRSEVVNQIAQMLVTRINHASTKHAQTKGRTERTHASLKTSLKSSTGERRSMLHKYVQIAVMNYNTSYHETLGCETTTRQNPVQQSGHQARTQPRMEERHQRRPNERTTTTNSRNTSSCQRQPNAILKYFKYKRYYDKKALATPLKFKDYCFVLNPKADNQSMKFAFFKSCIWTGPYNIVKVLSNNNYVVRRTGTRYTQTLHRIRISHYAPNQRIPDLTVKEEDQLPYPENKTTNDDWYARAKRQWQSLHTDHPADRKSPKTPELPPIVVGYTSRKVGRYNLRPHPKPNIDPVFKILEAVTTDNAYPPWSRTKTRSTPDWTGMATFSSSKYIKAR